ncbi:hypothetical protein F7725_013572 [Dissostichus mawsoni]|uniref:Uncharacterized protein n=1 Tax=Dissostichus mawsoni TaxID=36200 RepID=A0A7J5Y5C4_DISMA|nr:hypothetical protein F7725_013572 [Dissostichus mawsoni]
MLQAKDVDIHKAVGLLQNTIQALSAYRDDFDQSEFTEIRKRRMKRHFDELSQDERLSDGESRFRINVFNASLDIINSQLSQRFTSMRETNELFQAIHPGTLNRAQDNALHQHAQRLADHYSRDLSPSFPVQLLAFRACFKTEIAKEPSVKDMTKMLIEALQYLTSVGRTGREKKPNIFLATFNVDKHRGVSCSSTKRQEPDADWTFSTNSLVVLSGGSLWVTLHGYRPHGTSGGAPPDRCVKENRL